MPLSRLVFFSALALFCGCAQGAPAPDQAAPPLIPEGRPPMDFVLCPASEVWRYRDDGVDPGPSWRDVDFDDERWSLGRAQLGYGDGDEVTVLSFGADPNQKHVTAYFRRAFQVDAPADIGALTLRLLRDDGALVYLNGVEVARSNMPQGPILPGTLASGTVSDADENAFFSFAPDPRLLRAGTNVLAAEVHQVDRTSSDFGFDLSLTGRSGARVVRGPYLQLATDHSVVIRWRTDLPGVGRVRFGPLRGAASRFVDEAEATTEHVVAVDGLVPSTVYHYSIGTPTHTLAGADPLHHFTTAPRQGVARSTRIWVLGDSGTANQDAQAVRDAFAGFTRGRGADLILMLGDNAYNSGTDAEYQAAVFDLYPGWLRTTPLWPALGNHDGQSAESATQSGPYYDIFSLPRHGEAGGVPSGTEAYYAFDHGDIHFISLDSYETSRATGGAMLSWLRADLLANRARWTVAFWHHPPYSKGTHDSDTEIEMVEMRQNALPILEQHGVDVVLTGHSHAYERSFLLDGHYGLSNTLTPAMKKDPGSGREDRGAAYRKATLGPAAHEGAVYVVAGSSGQIGGGALNHPAMYLSLNQLGSLVIDVERDRLEAKFLSSAGLVTDTFTLRKGALP